MVSFVLGLLLSLMIVPQVFADPVPPLFVTQGALTLQHPSEHIADGDFNGDGSVDLLIRHPDGFSVLLNAAGTGFQNAVYYPTGPVQYLLVDDFDVDGADDVLVNETLYLADVDGFRDGMILDLGGVLPMASGDVDGDGIPDIAGTHLAKASTTGRDPHEWEVHVFPGLGDGRVGSAVVSQIPTATNLWVKDIRDLTFDGIPDLVVVAEKFGDEWGPLYTVPKQAGPITSYQTRVLAGSGNGHFGEQVLLMPEILHFLVDLDADGRDDAVCRPFWGGIVTYLISETGFTTALSIYVDVYSTIYLYPVIVSDIIGDSFNDIGMFRVDHDHDTQRYHQYIKWYAGNGDGTMTEAGIFDLMTGSEIPRHPFIIADDFNRDGRTDFAMTRHDSTSVTVYYNETETAVSEDLSKTAAPFWLCPPAPNPFNAHIAIPYELARDGHVTLDVFNIAGQRVRTLTDTWRAAGLHRAVWDARDDRGLTLSGGVYVCRLACDGSSVTTKIVYVK